MTPAMAVVGAINVDLVVRGPRLPGPGETVVGGDFSQHHGGKGGNQAVAAARALGDSGSVAMIGAVGDDELGRGAIQALLDEGVEPCVATVEAPTGVALISVDGSGENQISVAPGANSLLRSEHVRSALERVEPTIVLASLEVPLEAVRAAAEWSRSRGATFVLNPAPALPHASELLPLVDILTPNRGELAALGIIPAGVRVIQTLGAGGASIHGQADISARHTDAVDTTGAGDCFNGALAAALLEGFELREAVERAVAAAALSTTKTGAREGMPTRAEIQAALEG